jgi:hypothetical protein
LGLTQEDVLHVLGNFAETDYEPDTELRSVVGSVRGRMLRVVFRPDEQGLIVVSVQVEMDDEDLD